MLTLITIILSITTPEWIWGPQVLAATLLVDVVYCAGLVIVYIAKMTKGKDMKPSGDGEVIIK